MHACDGQTDRRTDGQTDRILLAIPGLHYMQRGKNCYETETKNYETGTSPVKSIVCRSNTNRYVSFFIHHSPHVVNDELEWILHLR